MAWLTEHRTSTSSTAVPSTRRGAGLDPFTVVQTLVMEDGGRPLLVLMPWQQGMSTKTLKRQIGVKSVAPCQPGQPTGTAATSRRHLAPARGAPCRSISRKPSWRCRIAINGGRRGYLSASTHRSVLHCWTPGPCAARWTNRRAGEIAPSSAGDPVANHLSIPGHRGRVPAGLLLSLCGDRQPPHGDWKDQGIFGKNPGATSMLRSGSGGNGEGPAARCPLKGWLPVVLVRWFGQAPRAGRRRSGAALASGTSGRCLLQGRQG